MLRSDIWVRSLARVSFGSSLFRVPVLVWVLIGFRFNLRGLSLPLFPTQGPRFGLGLWRSEMTILQD